MVPVRATRNSQPVMDASQVATDSITEAVFPGFGIAIDPGPFLLGNQLLNLFTVLTDAKREFSLEAVNSWANRDTEIVGCGRKNRTGAFALCKGKGTGLLSACLIRFSIFSLSRRYCHDDLLNGRGVSILPACRFWALRSLRYARLHQSVFFFLQRPLADQVLHIALKQHFFLRSSLASFSTSPFFSCRRLLVSGGRCRSVCVPLRRSSCLFLH